ncbi:MAG: Spy/CpxP family protein refolding chaperone [candidate division KSB1 bacterium]|nr:Spy/CpxP family protein refolding chaperone [candidate division KSB1 bacterium]MDZ7333544.1 Spy/CpxP family protein refolding chaperone [candidate division KSB1 bacterium]MDZ7358190.1 Spy/CpxP family protein refolding chaperone [candidate division KSB1 bacterium]MDZ7375713.1 Spy/CpxP family protein refolding chaperone [candidate division KSB1 bacterium]MDZ7398658.1 Spy/CpxP family protein refolding chaperone [candidate division KSB1 bacterium]
MKHNRSFVLFAVAFILVAFVAILPAQPRCGRAGKPGFHHQPWMSSLNLTDEQKNKVAELRLAFQKELLPLRTELQSKAAELQLLETEATPNLNQIDRLIDQIEQIRTKIHKARVRHQMAIRNILSPEQQKVWDSQMLRLSGRGKVGERLNCPLESF